MTEEFIERLKKLARRKCWGDKFEEPNNDSYVDDMAGGNVDDAYQGGLDTGETWLARDILTELKIDWK